MSLKGKSRPMPPMPEMPNFMAPPEEAQGDTHPLKLTNGDWDWDKVVDAICEAIMDSSQYLSYVVEEGYQGHEYPRLGAIRSRIYRNEKYKAQYKEARVIQTDGLVDLMHSVVRDTTRDTVKDERGGERANSSAVARSRLIADHYKWYVGIMDPSEWTGTTKVEHSGQLSIEGVLDELRNKGAGKLPIDESPIDG